MNLRIQFNLAILLLLIPAMVFANSEIDLKSTKEKSIKKSFDVSAYNTLKVNNSYGNLDVVTWNENRIAFDITIKVTGNDSEKVQERLNEINIEFSNSDNIVSGVTKFGNEKRSWWNWGSNNKLKVEVNYRIKMPITNNVELNNDYGSINLDRLEGTAKLVCDYGKITTKELMADNNFIRFDYSKNCYFEYIKSGEIKADYSGFTVAKTEELVLKADYTESIIEAAENVNYTCDYGSLKIDNLNNLDGQGDYLSLRLGNIYKTVNLKANYGSIKIERMASKAKSVNITSDYVGITIGHDASFNFDFDIDLEYGSLRESEGFSFTNKEVDYSDKKYDGYYGAQNSGNFVKIDSEYGSVTFKKL
ncbi:hypothetical protein [Winogradskyella schleiferi]|uniref:hypothetical protein n=1 Tax=Winogradskyella schleiferi TaxID=2686078 RepID=UPI0015C11209|nr:hypothetical protein [Winogradskyella schleiferi]